MDLDRPLRQHRHNHRHRGLGLATSIGKVVERQGELTRRAIEDAVARLGEKLDERD